MKNRDPWWFFFTFMFFCLGCIAEENQTQEVNREKALSELGHFLFFDKRLSLRSKLSCSSCHDPQFAFSDGYRVSLNDRAEKLLRNSPSILNLNERDFFSWSDPSISTLEKQMIRPLFSTHPLEMGIKGNEHKILQRIKTDVKYQKIYREAFGYSIDSITLEDVIHAIAYYEIGLQSRNSKFDQWKKTGYRSGLTPSEISGYNIFMSDSVNCNACHGGHDFYSPENGDPMANTGLYNCNSSYPAEDQGYQMHTGDYNHNGVFRIPTLRNIAITAPYYHDGSSISLEEVIKNYERGGRKNLGSNCNGDGADHPNVDDRLKKFSLSDKQRSDLIAFLHTLTDTSYLKEYYFQDPINP